MALWPNYLPFDCGSRSILRPYKSAVRQQKQAQSLSYRDESVHQNMSGSRNQEQVTSDV